MGFLLRLVAYAAGLAIAAWVLPDMYFYGPNGGGSAEMNAKVLPLLGVALILNVVNAIVRPVVRVFAFPLVVLTLGLFLLVINGFMLLLTDAIAGKVGLRFQVDGLVTAMLGAFIVTAAVWTVDFFAGDDK